MRCNRWSTLLLCYWVNINYLCRLCRREMFARTMFFFSCCCWLLCVACVWLLFFFSSVPFGCCSWAGFSYTQLIHVFSFNWIGSIRRNHTHAHNIYATDNEMEIGWRNANRSKTSEGCSRERNIVSKIIYFSFHRRHTLATFATMASHKLLFRSIVFVEWHKSV